MRATSDRFDRAGEVRDRVANDGEAQARAIGPRGKAGEPDVTDALHDNTWSIVADLKYEVTFYHFGFDPNIARRPFRILEHRDAVVKKVRNDRLDRGFAAS